MPKSLLLWLLLSITMLSCQSHKENSSLQSLSEQGLSEPLATAETVLQPAPGTSIVTGMLKVEHTNQPMVGVELYLASHIGADESTPMYSLEPDSSPHTTVQDDGRFIFKDVPPGRYAIVVWNPFNSFLARDPVTGSELVIDVQADQVYDVGTLFEPLPQ